MRLHCAKLVRKTLKTVVPWVLAKDTSTFMEEGRGYIFREEMVN